MKLPAAHALRGHLGHVPKLNISPDQAVEGRTFREIRYKEHHQVGYLHFEFYNGAMSTSQCRRLQRAYRWARRRPTKAIVLMGGHDLWSNGIDLTAIEAAADPALESWRNINAIDDLVRDIITTESHLTCAAMAGNAGAGGAILALAADVVYARHGVVLNPHYQTMHLFGSEYWTYLLPRRVGARQARELTEACQPISSQHGQEHRPHRRQPSRARTRLPPRRAPQLETLTAGSATSSAGSDTSTSNAASHETVKPLQAYREEELAQMRHDFAQPGTITKPAAPFCTSRRHRRCRGRRHHRACLATCSPGSRRSAGTRGRSVMAPLARSRRLWPWRAGWVVVGTAGVAAWGRRARR